MIQEAFAQGDSPIHRTNPVLRVVLATIYSITVAPMTRIFPLALALGFSVLLIILSKPPIKPLANRVFVAAIFLSFVWIMVPVSISSGDIALIGPFYIERAGIELCQQVTLKAMAILLAFIALVASMPTATLGHALYSLGLPAKLIHLLLLAYRYIFLLEQEYQRLLRAAKMRNFKPGTNTHTYRTYGYLVGMLFVRASERAERVYQAMKCRGFKGQFYTLATYHATPWNAVIGIGVGMVSFGVLFLEWAV